MRLREHLQRWMLFLIGSVVVVYTALLIGISAYSQHQSSEALLANAENEFDVQVRVLRHQYERVSQSALQLAGLRSIQTFYANSMLGMSYEYGLSDSLYSIADEVRKTLQQQKLADQVGCVVFNDTMGGYSQAVAMNNVEARCAERFSRFPHRTTVFFDGRNACLEIPVSFKGEVHGELHVEMVQSVFDMSGFSQLGRYYLIDPSGSAWFWDSTAGFWLATESPPHSPDYTLEFSAALSDDGFRLIRHLPRDQVLGFTQTREFVLALSILGLVVCFGGYKAVRYRGQTLVLSATVEQQREHNKTLSESNHRLEQEMMRRAALEEQLSYRAQHDLLTGLPNRELAVVRIDDAILRGIRNKRAVGVVFCDLDRFKQVNDTLGHVAGDQLVATAAERLKSVVRASDTVCRFGGDEFLVVLESVDSRMDVEDVCQKLASAFQQPFSLNSHEFTVTCSMGVAMFPQDSRTSADLIKQADTALYKAKADGRATWRFYQPAMDVALQSRLYIEQRLLSKQWDQLLYVAYQPVVDLAADRMVGVEALLRWRNEDYVVGPDIFVPIAEDLGLVGELGEWVLRRAIKDTRSLMRMGVRVFVNVSPQQFVWRSRLADVVNQVVEEEGISHFCLGLELTESSLVRNVEEVKSSLDQLATAGVSLAIDDFGTGYSSLSYLKRFPFDRIKIDKSFVRDICDDTEDLELVKAIIAMARAMRLNVIAEGVENEAQLQLLKDLGCDCAQGYFISRPVPIDAMLEFYERWQMARAIC